EMFAVSVLLIAVVMEYGCLRHAWPRTGGTFRIRVANGHAEGDEGVWRKPEDFRDLPGCVPHDAQKDDAQPDRLRGQRGVLGSQTGIDRCHQETVQVLQYGRLQTLLFREPGRSGCICYP